MVEKKSVTIGLIQTRVSDDIKNNMENTISKIREAAAKGAQIICLQELYRTKYFPTDEEKDVTLLAEPIPGETTSTLSTIAKELNVIIIAPIFEVDPSGKHYNTAVVIGPDKGIMGKYRKMHIPYDPFFYEKSYFDVGDTGYQLFRTPNITFGVLICYDQWFPEAARTLALQGADLIFYPSAIGYLEGDPLSQDDWHTSWENIQRSHAIANGIHVASINRVGTEGNIKFWGASFVCDAFGRLIKRASEENEEVLVAELDISMNKRMQDGWGFRKNRLPGTYGIISSRVISDTPKTLGFAMPAEWERHDATWLAWPHDPLTFPNRISKVEKAYLKIIMALSKSEEVNLFVTDLKMRSRVTKLLEQNHIDLQKINFYVWDYADVWFRDYGPIFVLNKEKKQLAFVHWIFNAWGGKYKELIKDSQIPYIISQRLQLNNFRPGVVLEGGSVDVNGKGTLITTEQCLLNKNRNPNLSKVQVEEYLSNYFGITKTIWLKSGVAGDDTDGHIDNLARFVNPRTILCAYEEDENDENHRALKENYDTLIQSTDQDGKKFKVIKVPMPSAIRSHVRGEKTRLPASYLNFYISNKVVLVPIYKKKTDRIALKIIQDVFRTRKVVGIDCTDVIYGMGAIHCIMQQQPTV
ncbi:MAG TPA: agmatine deiminase family protein [Candidatus Eisenbacteria bacterium]|nr:agmatine deiminase family protein [Candidatus Eisenbacteria bacterium]